jgi:serine phosphatase RsbU (regulator of sigma subunit)/anti-sigma regulatory factor (Ser/Thr protein kinase)
MISAPQQPIELEPRLAARVAAQFEGLRPTFGLSYRDGSNESVLIPGGAGEKIVPREIPMDNGPVLVLYGADGDPSLDLAERLIRATLQRFEAQKWEQNLLDELNLAWESLDALYKMNSDLRMFTNAGQLLDGMVGRAVSSGMSLTGHELSVCLFLNRNGRMVAETVRNTPGLAAGSDSGAWAERECRGRETTLLNSRAQIEKIQGRPLYLTFAEGLILAPVATRQGVEGVLAAWSTRPGVIFHAVRLMEAFAGQAAMIVESERLYATMVETERMRSEIEIGSSIQAALLLEAPPAGISGCAIATTSAPARGVNGDLYDFTEHPDATLDVVIGDVMGKGVPAALVGAAMKNSILRANVSVYACGAGTVSMVVGAMARHLCRRLIELERFVTLCYARIDPSRRKLTFVDCGHTAILHYRRQSDDCVALHGTNMPIGFSEAEDYEEVTASLTTGDILLLYSDGVTEAAAKSGELFGEPRLIGLVPKFAQEAPDVLLRGVRAAVGEFAGAGGFDDDFTCIAVRIGDPRPCGKDEIEVLTDLAELCRIRGWLREFVGGTGRPDFGGDFCDQFELALTEAASNVMRHAYRGRKGIIRIEATAYADRLRVAIRHRGEAFDPSNVPEPVLDNPAEGGLGLFLMRQTVDQIAYGVCEDGTRTTSMTKFIRGEEL